MAEKLGNGVWDAPFKYHAFTGCDNTRAFMGKGKKTAFSLLFSGKTEAMKELGG